MATADPVKDLDRELERTLGLYRASNVTEWLSPERERTYLVRPRVRLVHHFDLEPAFLIRDSVLGTLGLVHLVEADAKSDVESQVRKHVDSATYARHLLLRDPLRGSAAALTVELVLLTRNDPKVLEGIGSALRELLRTTDSLFEVGISLLAHKGGDNPFGGSLRRGLPWLLTAARQWLTSDLSRPPKPKPDGTSDADAVRAVPDGARVPGAVERVESIRLTNYRLSGSREFALARTRVHLVYGANGTGKSTLVEALELLTSGKVERLERAGEEDYARVIKNRSSADPACISIRRGDQAKTWRVIKGGLDKPPRSAVPSSSFRLDQPLMDRLVGNFPHERANHYMNAFFPEATGAADKYVSAARKRDDALSTVRLEIETLQKARAGLQAIADWRGGGAHATVETFPDLLNRWLERTALADLARREHAVRATLQAAREASWVTSDHVAGVLADVGAPPEVVAEQLRRWSAEAEKLLQELNSLRPSSDAEGVREGHRYTLTEEQCKALNVVCPWLFDSAVLEAHGVFGDKLVKVLSSGDAPTFGAIIIGGAEGWATPVLNDIDTLLGACQQLLLGKPPITWPGKKPWPAYEGAAEQEKAFLAASADLSKGFVELLGEGGREGHEFDGSLIAAVNELMALFTPARWGYEDIQLPSRLADGRVMVAMELGPKDNASRAELQLNTAELNLFTIALFLLCAGRVAKPLGLVVLDDPLQNMDELTSTALARGMAKVIRAWQQAERSEELLLLFHGTEDLQRFQDELSGATYRLPWLSPSQAPSEIKIEAERMAARQPAVQGLEKLVEPTPPPAGGAAG